jgi:hypothetical protein
MTRMSRSWPRGPCFSPGTGRALSYDMGRNQDDRETSPPAQADEQAADFEAAISERGESSARWTRLMALLEERES